MKANEDIQKHLELIKKERRRYLTYNYMYRSPQDIEEMVAALRKHYEVVKKTTIKDLTMINNKK